MAPVRSELDRLDDERFAEAIGVLAPAVVTQRLAEVRGAVRRGRWQFVGRCVVMHNGPLSSDQLMWVAVLSPRPTAALARESALTAAGVRGLASVLVVVHAHGLTPARVPGVTYTRSRHLDAVDLEPGSHPLRTTSARAVVDAARHSSRERARTLVAMTVQQRKSLPKDVRSVLGRIGPVRHHALLTVTVDDVEGGSHSLPELRFVRLMRRARLPVPGRQVVRRRPDGRCFLDVGWDDYGLFGEIDGTHHRNAAQWEADVLRTNELVIGGDRVLRLLSWWVRDRPDLVIDVVTRALISCGWRP